MKAITKVLSEITVKAFSDCGYEGNFGSVTVSDRPDLCQFQCNGSFAAAKAFRKAPVMIAKDVAEKLKETGIFKSADAVAPGFILNPRSKLILGTVEEGLTKRGQDVINHTPMGKFGSANDMCGAIRWLIDDRSAGFVTGITVPVDGGFLTLSGV